MKRFISIMLVLSLSLSILVGCGTSKDAGDKGDKGMDNGKDIEEEKENEGVEVDKKLLNVEVTLPQELIAEDDGEVDYEEIAKEAKAEGIKEVKVNDDGSVTYVMSKTKHRELMDEMEKALKESIEEMINGEDFPSIKDIKTNNKLSEFEISVDRENFENSIDGFAIFGVVLSSMYYQMFDGVNPDNYKVTVNLKDADSGQVYDTIIYPDAFGEE